MWEELGSFLFFAYDILSDCGTNISIGWVIFKVQWFFIVMCSMAEQTCYTPVSPAAHAHIRTDIY